MNTERRNPRWSCWPLMGLYTAMTAVVLLPIATVQVPGLGDYLNHLARMHILSEIGHSEALRGFYEVHWQPIPYLAMDAVFIVLNKVVPIYDAGRIYIAFCVVLPAVSVAVLHFAVHRRLSPSYSLHSWDSRTDM